MIQESIQEKDITIVNSHAPNIDTPQYIRQTLTDIKGDIDSNTIILGDFNTTHTPMDRLSKQKINKQSLKWYIRCDRSHWYLQDIPSKCRSARETFSRIDHTLGHKSNLNKFKKTEIIPSIFSDHNTMRLDINYKKKTVRYTNTWRFKQQVSK